jgi:regulator of sirC expression with transglutaminase-like and TPR domain
MTSAFERFVAAVKPGSHMSLTTAAALLAAHRCADLDLGALERQLAGLAEPLVAGDRAQLLLELFGPGKFAGHTDRYYDPDNSYLHRVLDRRLGIPISLAVLAMDIGRRAGVQLAGVGFPGHFLLRDISVEEVFIDPFGGRLLTEGDCVAWFHRRFPQGARWQREFLQPVDDATVLTRMISNLIQIFERDRNFPELAWLMKLRCALPNATDAERQQFAKLMSPLN